MAKTNYSTEKYALKKLITIDVRPVFTLLVGTTT